MNNGEFTSRDVTSSNVGELRNELEIPTDANVNIGGTIRQNDFALEDGAYVAYTSNDYIKGSRMNLDLYLNTVINQNLYSTKKKLKFHMASIFGSLNFHNKKVLDIGGGSGFYSLYTACRGAKKVLCLEPEAQGSASGSIKKFEKLNKILKCNNVEIIPTTFQLFENNNELFDVILLNNSINHLDEEACVNLKYKNKYKERYNSIFSKLYKISNKDAKIIITDCSRYNFFALFKIKNPFSPTIEWEKHQTPETWVKLLTDVGFKNPKIRWTTHNTFGNLGRIILGNKLIAYFLKSHFHITIQK